MVLLTIIGIHAENIYPIVKNEIAEDGKGKYIFVGLENRGLAAEEISYYNDDDYYGDLLIGDKFTFKRVGIDRIIAIKTTGDHDMKKLKLNEKNIHWFKVYEKDLRHWVDSNDKKINFEAGMMVMATYRKKKDIYSEISSDLVILK